MTLLELRGWFVLTWRFIRYFAYRFGMGSRPQFVDIYREGVPVLDRLLGWPKMLRFEDGHNCPRHGPVVFAGNHQKKDDPFLLYRAIHYLCDASYAVRFMMRDDFFAGISAAKSRFIDVDELACMAGALLISRSNVQLSQMKPFVKLLREGNGFIMYPGRSRSRSGVFIEYRDGIEEPGGVTFFLAQAQRGRPDLRIPAVPCARTHNPTTNKTVIIFGEPQYLPHDADRAVQRDLDFRLIEMMGELTEVNAAHVTAGILYLRCLHGHSESITLHQLKAAVKEVLDACRERRVEPASRNDLDGQMKAVLAYLERGKTIVRTGDSVTPNVDVVLSAPEWDTSYVEKNPLKHLVNQVLHLWDVVAAIEFAAFKTF
ncbi:MAG: 1-acyl-sn-glycerol-3-phosphate acyltransferase [Candidatus Hydrogenedentes bacterium]|nr:1-acyl-sn-glycerol-3-phosphate acyltransferase [Candidatus Hydrogenedentota bacterium]